MSVVRLQSDRVDIRRQWQSNGRQCTREIMHDERAVRSNHELSITENIPELNRYSIQWVKFLSAVDRFVLLPTRSRLELDNLFNGRSSSNSCFFSFLPAGEKNYLTSSFDKILRTIARTLSSDSTPRAAAISETELHNTPNKPNYSTGSSASF